MLEKIKLLVSSIRFWLVVVFGIFFALGYGDIIDQALAKAVEFSALIVAIIGTFDRAAENIGKK